MVKKVSFFMLIILLLSLSIVTIVNASNGVSENNSLLVDKEIEVLNNKVDNLRNEFNNTLDIILWIFGIAVTLILAIVGSFGFFSIKLNDKDKKAIKSDLKNLLNQEIKNIESKNQKHKEELKELFNNEMKSVKEKNNEQINSKINSKIKTIKEENKIIKSVQIEHKIKHRKKEFGLTPGLLYHYWQLIKVSKNLWDIEWKIGEALEEVEEILENADKLRNDEEENFRYLIDELPDKYEIQKQRLIKKAKNL